MDHTFIDDRRGPGGLLALEPPGLTHLRVPFNHDTEVYELEPFADLAVGIVRQSAASLLSIHVTDVGTGSAHKLLTATNLPNVNRLVLSDVAPDDGERDYPVCIDSIAPAMTPSLAVLGIRDHHDAFDRLAARVAAGDFPSLTTVIVRNDADAPAPQGGDEPWGSLRTLLANHGITVEPDFRMKA